MEKNLKTSVLTVWCIITSVVYNFIVKECICSPLHDITNYPWNKNFISITYQLGMFCEYF